MVKNIMTMVFTGGLRAHEPQLHQVRLNCSLFYICQSSLLSQLMLLLSSSSSSSRHHLRRHRHHRGDHEVSSALRLIFPFSPLAVSCLQPTKIEPKIEFQFKIFQNCICISSNKSCLCRFYSGVQVADVFCRIQLHIRILTKFAACGNYFEYEDLRFLLTAGFRIQISPSAHFVVNSGTVQILDTHTGALSETRLTSSNKNEGRRLVLANQ